MKRFRPKDGSGSAPAPGRNSARDFHGEKRSRGTHASQTHPEARLYRKSRGQGAPLCYQSHILMENRNGLIVDHELTSASGTGESTAAVEMVNRLPGSNRGVVAADRGYVTADYIDELRSLNATPHIAQNTKHRRPAIDARHQPASGVHGQSAHAQADRGDPRLGQDGRSAASREGPALGASQASPSAYLRRLQPGRNAQPGKGRAITFVLYARNQPKESSGTQNRPIWPPHDHLRVPIQRNGSIDPFTTHDTVHFYDNLNTLLTFR